LALVGVAMAYAWLSAARSREISEILSIVPGMREISATQQIAEPTLVHLESPRTWVFALNKDQAQALKMRCAGNEKISPLPRIEHRTLGCVASYYYDTPRYRYIVVTLKGDVATLKSLEMSQTDFDDQLMGRHRVISPSRSTPSPG
jgi:hypothetical protein